jgi:alkylation response protein AidB-like acyl-CoA dehydrogenase
MNEAGAKSGAQGGSWLLEPGDASSVLTPERVSDEHRLIAQTAQEFAAKEVVPAIDRLEQKDWTMARQLLRRAGELGLLGVDAPEEYGGVGMDKAAALVVSRYLSGSASFNAAFGAHGNLAIVPILLFGTADQKNRYLPQLISGELGRLCAERIGIRLRCAERTRARSDARRRRLFADRRKDVDH